MKHHSSSVHEILSVFVRLVDEIEVTINEILEPSSRTLRGLTSRFENLCQRNLELLLIKVSVCVLHVSPAGSIQSSCPLFYHVHFPFPYLYVQLNVF